MHLQWPAIACNPQCARHTATFQPQQCSLGRQPSQVCCVAPAVAATTEQPVVPGPLGPTTSYQQQLTADCFSIQPAYSPQIRVSQRLAGAAAAAEADAGGGCGARLLLQAGKQDQQQQLFAGQQEGVVPGSRHTADAACDSHQQAIGGGQAALQQLLQHSSCAVDIAEGDSRQAQQQWQAFQQDQQPHQQQHWVQHQEQLTVQQRVQDHSFATHWYTGQGNDHWNSLHVAMQQQQQTRQEARLVYLKRLSSALKGRHSCSSVEQLSSILVQHGRYMDGQALTAAFTAAARLAKQHAQLCGSPKEQQRQQLTLLVQQVLLPLLRRKLGLLDVVGLVLVLQALGALQCAHDDLIVSDVVRAVVPSVRQLSPRLLSQLTWAVAQLSPGPSAAAAMKKLRKRVLQRSGEILPDASGQDVAQLLHGLMQLQEQPPLDWLQSCHARVSQLCTSQQLQPQSLCMILYNLARIARKCFEQEPQQQARSPLAGRNPAQVAAAVAAPGHVVQQLLRAAEPMLWAAAPAAAAAAAAGGQAPNAGGHNGHLQQEAFLTLGCLHQQCQNWHVLQGTAAQQVLPQVLLQVPLEAQTQQLQQQQQQQQPPQPPLSQQQQLTPTGLNMLVRALQLLRQDPYPQWQAAYLAAAGELMHACDARNLPVLLAPVVRWKLAPGREWMQQYLDTCEVQLPHMQPQGLAVLGHSLAALQVRPSQTWLCSYLVAAGSSRLASTTAGCSYLTHTLGSWRQMGMLQPQPQPQPQPSQPQPQPSQPQPSQPQPSQPPEQQPAAAGSFRPAAASDAVEAVGPASSCSNYQLAVRLMADCAECFADVAEAGCTPEQLGMFCKGLTMWGAQAGPRLSRQLNQVAWQLLHQRDQAGVFLRFRATTLSNLLLALAVSAPQAATSWLLASIWSSWIAYLLPETTAAHAVAVAWSARQLGVEPPSQMVSGLLVQVVALADEVELPHVARLLLHVGQANWRVGGQQVQQLLEVLLAKQAQEVALLQAEVAATAAGCCQQHQQQPTTALELQQWQQEQHQQQQEKPSSHASLQDCQQQVGSNGCGGSRSFSAAAAAAPRLFGLANHRLRACLLATAAVAAWAGALQPVQRVHALQLCRQYAQWLPDTQQQQSVEVYMNQLKQGMHLLERQQQQQQQQ